MDPDSTERLAEATLLDAVADRVRTNQVEAVDAAALPADLVALSGACGGASRPAATRGAVSPSSTPAQAS